MAQRYPISAAQGNRFLAAATVLIGTGGLPTSVAGYPGLGVTRLATGAYQMDFPPVRHMRVNYSVQASPSLAYVRGITLAPRPSGQLTGMGAFEVRTAAGLRADPQVGDEITIWFYASESDAS